MAVRLYPDIIVATEIDSILSFEGDPNDVVVYIGNCLAHQRTYAARFGIRDAFIGFEGKEWIRDDYERYLRSLPEFFKKIDDGGYLVNMKKLEKSDVQHCGETEYAKLDSTQKYSYGRLLTQGTYNRHVLSALSITI